MTVYLIVAGVILWAMVVLVAVSLCRAAGEADRRDEVLRDRARSPARRGHLMPYIVTTRREGRLPGKENDAAWSRRAIATLNDAQVILRDALLAADCDAGDPEWTRHWPAIFRLPESGGTVGPLPDGTVIEVVAVQWRTLCDLTAERYPGNDADRDRILDAFNARESA